jgi:acyl-CoA reductase-like NAD-dependent aldehyde dehydrogenase
MTANLTLKDATAAANKLRIRDKAFIGGKYVAAASGKSFDTINPATGKLLASVSSCDAEDVNRAVGEARKAFEDGRWSRRPPAERKKILLRFAALIEHNLEELALLDTLDMGKPLKDSSTVDVPNSAAAIQWSAEAVDKIYGEVAPTAVDALGFITREPMGVVAAVVPWNFPLMMAAWKIGPILASGNSLILKPAEQSPLSALRIAELASEAGIPDGVFNVLPGMGETAGAAIGLHMDVDCVAFTGSTAVGKLFLQYAGKSNMKRVNLECGGKSPAIILADADIAHAAKTAAWSVFFNQGECCDALSRVLVHRSIKDEVVEMAAELARSLQVGDPLDPKTDIGAIVDDTQLGRIMEYVHLGKQEGARLVSGGRRLHEKSGGFFVEPTVFDNVDNRMRLAREEIFGPVISTIEFGDDDEAVRIANDTNYGLVGAVFTSDINRAHKLARAMRCGAVWVNCFDAGDMTVPHGGFKESGIGRDRSLHSLDKYSELKTTWVQLR